MNFFKQAGKLALGTRVRSLADLITQDAIKIYEAYETQLHPKWFSVFYTLTKTDRNSVTSIAEHIGHSHVSVSKIVAEMSKAGLIIEKSDSKDRRRTQVSLSKKGQKIAEKIEDQYTDVVAAIEDISSQATHNLWAAIEEWEYLLNSKNLYGRVTEHRKKRESSHVKIVSFQPKFKKAFYELNAQWINTYFKMEKPDRVALQNPQEYILDQGGHIFIALLDQRPIGTCALIKRDDKYQYELAKMAVAPEAQGKNIGFLLGKAVIEKARAMKADRIYLESNTKLAPALRLYEKLGFKKIVGPPTPYERCDIQMELKLKN